MTALKTLPKNDGFRMPAEHEAHEFVWLVWPYRADNWRQSAKPAQQAFAEVAHAISKTTKVCVAVDEHNFKEARTLLADNINIVEIKSDDAWMRDTGPSYVVNDKGERRGVDWHFNAWGGLVDGLYSPWNNDDMVARKVCQFHGDLRYRAPIILEGGSIHVDGEGTLYTTEECLLHESRNPQLSKHEIEQVLKDYLSVEKVIWIEKGLYNDETNGHVDNLMHIVKPAEVVLTMCDDKDDPQYAISKAAYELLSNSTDAKGRKIKVHKLPMPEPLFITETEAASINTANNENVKPRPAGDRLAASYANYLITNKQIIYPRLDERYDDQVAEILQTLYSDYQITGIDAREILLGGGNIHCITQQVPKV